MNALTEPRVWTADTLRDRAQDFLHTAQMLAETFVRARQAARLCERYAGMSDGALAARGMTREEALREIHEVVCGPARRPRRPR